MQVRMVEIDNGPGGISWEGQSDFGDIFYETEEDMMSDAISLSKYGVSIRFITLAEYELEMQLTCGVNPNG